MKEFVKRIKHDLKIQSNIKELINEIRSFFFDLIYYLQMFQVVVEQVTMLKILIVLSKDQFEVFLMTTNKVIIQQELLKELKMGQLSEIFFVRKTSFSSSRLNEMNEVFIYCLFVCTYIGIFLSFSPTISSSQCNSYCVDINWQFFLFVRKHRSYVNVSMTFNHFAMDICTRTFTHMNCHER